jgi:hypothetical protein
MSDKTSAFDELDYFELNPMLKQPCSQGYFRRATTSGASRPIRGRLVAAPASPANAGHDWSERAYLCAHPDVAAAYAEASFRADSHIGPRT